MTQILITESSDFSPVAATLLRDVGQVTLADIPSARELKLAISNAEVLWIRLRHRIDEQVLAAAPGLRIIVTPTTGLNHIDLEAAERRGIRVLSLRDEQDFLRNVRATAEHTVGLMLALLRRLPDAVAHTRRGGWCRDEFKGHELYEKTVGLVGYGRLGRLVARYLLAFGSRVLATDPHVMAADVEPNVEFVDLPDLLEQSDLVSLHVVLNPETIGFFGESQFCAMKPGAWFINTARGELIDESALLKSLRSGHLRGAAVDVLTQENPEGMSHNRLVAYAREHTQLIVTPHIGGCTWESMEKTEVIMAERLHRELVHRGTEGNIDLAGTPTSAEVPR